MTSLRIMLALGGLASVLFFPPWMTLVFVVLLALRFRAWEGIVLGLCVDLLWLPLGGPITFVPFYTLASMLIVWGLEPLRLEFLR